MDKDRLETLDLGDLVIIDDKGLGVSVHKKGVGEALEQLCFFNEAGCKALLLYLAKKICL